MSENADKIANLEKRIEALEVMTASSGPGAGYIRTQQLELMSPEPDKDGFYPLLMRLSSLGVQEPPPGEDPSYSITFYHAKTEFSTLEVSARTGRVVFRPWHGEECVLIAGSTESE